MGFLSLYNSAKSLNEAKELTPFNTYDSYEQVALEKVFDDMKNEGIKYRDSLGYGGKRSEESKMKEYRDKGSNPVRLATATTQFGKLMYRYIWCMSNWPKAAEAYKLRIFEVIKETYPEKLIKYVKQQKDDEERARKFEADVQLADTDKYAPKQRDWEKMIDYMNKKSNPVRLADSCKDANKVISRFVIAKALHWNECVEEFKRRAKELNVATEAELEAYARKYANTNIPEQWQEYIDMLKETDMKGGIARHDENKSNDGIPERLLKALDNNIEVADYELIKNAYYNKTYMKIVRYDKPDIYVLCKRDIVRYRPKEQIYMMLTAYANMNDMENNINASKTAYANKATDVEYALDIIVNI